MILPSTSQFKIWVLLAFHLLPPVSATDVLKQIFVVTRHGSRHPLPKDGSTLVELSGGILTALGQKQHYDLGKYFREKYNQSGLVDTYHPNAIILESSSFERTVTSANSLALGLFTSEARDPNGENLMPVKPANVPVYTYERDNDIVIRAYDKCPAFQSRLESLYASAEWEKVEAENRALLSELAQMTAFRPFSNTDGVIPLEELWNVYDLIFVAKTECSGPAKEDAPIFCQTLPDPELATVLSDSDWARIQTLSHIAELMKYGQRTAGKVVGVNLLLEISRRMQSNNYAFHLFSGHYPTILGVFAALEVAFFEEDTIPHYASALVFEVTSPSEGEDTEKLFFKLYYRGNEANRVVPLDRICGNPTVCPVSSLDEYLGSWDTAKWCAECENESANVCLQLKVQEMERGEEDEFQDPLLLGVLVGVVTVGLFGLFAIICFMLRSCRKQQVSDDTCETGSTGAGIFTSSVDEGKSVAPQNVLTEISQPYGGLPQVPYKVAVC